MSDGEKLNSEQPAEGAVADGSADESAEKLNIMVAVNPHGACQRHVTVTVSREDVDRYFDTEFSKMMPEVQVPGFRPGHAPRKLVEHRFRKEVAERVKMALLMDGMGQANELEKLAVISEPDIDIEAVKLPDEGPFTFEFDVEVRPDFEVPQWKGLVIERPIRDFDDADVDRAMNEILANRGQLEPFDGPAESGDYVSVNLTFKDGETVVNKAQEEVIRIRPALSFRDGSVAHFDKAMEGVRAGESRQAEAQISTEAPNAALRGKTITAVFDVLEVKKLRLPELTPEFLGELGDFDSVDALREAVKEMLERRLQYQQRKVVREQITKALTAAASWDLPPDLLRRQAHRELQRTVMELQGSGFSDDEIRAHENMLRQNSMAETARALKEHFILERIAEEEKVEPKPEDFDLEIAMIAAQTGQSARRVRARLEKEGSTDALRNQIVERMVIGLIQEHAQFKDTPYAPEGAETEAIDRTAAGGEDSDIPEAKPGPEPETHEGKHGE